VITDHRVEQDFGKLGQRVVLLNARRLTTRSDDIFVVLTLRDNTELEFAKEYSEKIVDALRDPFLILDWDLRVRSANGPFYKVFQVRPGEVEGRLIYDLGNGQWNVPRLRELLEDILPKNSSFDDFEVEHEFEGIGRRVMLLNARRINHLRLILLVIEDVTEQKHAERQRTVLLGELQHRAKNLLMTVRALSELTIQGASSLESFGESFCARIDAMVRSQDLLVQGPETSALLAEVIRLELQSIGGRELTTFRLEGPELRLSARACYAFAMTAHELATNAAKYGALSKSACDGRVEVVWNISPAGDGKTALRLIWREHGLSTPPTRKGTGFGTQLVENSVPYLFGGSSVLSFGRDGIECMIETSLAAEDLPLPTVTQA